MKKIINHVDNVVTEFLEGVASAHPELKVNLDPMYILRREKGAPKVAIDLWRRVVVMSLYMAVLLDLVC